MTDTSKEFASALFELALETHTEEATFAALKDVRAIFDARPEALALLASPAIPKKERLAVLEKALGDAVPDQVMGFLQVLCSHGQIKHLNSCIDAYEELYNASHKLSTAYVTSAVPLDDEQKSKLKQQLEKRLGRIIRLECRSDASLLGGLIVEVDGKVIDGSLRHRLHEIKEVMNG